MVIKLLKITMKNAKGVKEFTFTPDGKNTLVSGDNKTGKTSIYDSYLWCLFDMDSTGRKGAEAIKTTNKEGGYVHFLDHEVTVSFEVDSKVKVFRKLLNEKWTTPRGKSEQRYDGNVTSYWVTDVPKQAKEYQDEVNSLIQDITFKILTDPFYFSEQLPWRERLSMLVEICGGVTNEEIVKDNKALQNLLETIGEMSMDDFKTMVSEQIRKINKEIDGIPPRIDELTKSIHETDDWAGVENSIDWYKKNIRDYENELMRAADANKPIIEAQRAIITLESERDALMKRLAMERNSKRNEADFERTNLVSDIRNIEQKISALKDSISRDRSTITIHENSKTSLRERFSAIQKDYVEESRSEFTPPEIGSLVCDKCGQTLPEDNIRERIQQAQDSFEKQKSQRLDVLASEKARINAEGKHTNQMIDEANGRIEEQSAEMKKLEGLLQEKQARLDRLSEEISSTPLSMPNDFKDHPEVSDINSRITAAKFKSAQNVEDQAADIYKRKSDAAKELERLTGVLFEKQNAEKTRQRIDELQDELKKVSGQKIQLEGQLHLCDMFVVERTKAIEGKINGMFSEVGFKLFKEQVNGGIEETCEAIVGETTFSKANTAGKINAGLDIINTISKFHGISTPVFIDCLESNLHLYPITASQYIMLQVAPHPIKSEFV